MDDDHSRPERVDRVMANSPHACFRCGERAYPCRCLRNSDRHRKVKPTD